MATFTDDFNRADSTNLGANWVEVSGDWSIVSNQLSPGAAGGTIILRAAGAMSTNDNSAQVTIAATTTASQGVWCRGNSNITQGYLWRNNGTSWDLFSVVGGSFTVIGTYTAAAIPGDVAKVQAVGTTIKGFVNGVQRVSVTDTAVTTGTSVGIRSDSAGALRFDDFTGADVATGATGDAALSGSAVLSASGMRATAGGAALTSTAGLTTGGIRGTSGAGGFTISASLAADGTVSTSATGSAAILAFAALAAAGAIGSTGAGSAVVSVALHASGQVSGAVVRGTARIAAGARPWAQRGLSTGPRAQRGEPARPTARGGAQ